MRTVLSVSVFAALTILSANAAGLPIATNGQSAYTIVVPADTIPSESTAATELQSHLAQVTGCTLPIAVEGTPEAAGTKRIVVGPGQLFREAFPNFDLESLKHDGIFIKTAGESLYLAGDKPRGTLYAVYTFLEDTVGCRWWTSYESYTPKKPDLEIPALDLVYVPKLRCREAFYRGAFDGVYAARSKCNGHFEQITPEYGGHYSILGWCHTFYQILPPEKYFEAHPEWYSEIGGKRTTENAQLCLTNEEMRAEFVKNALEWIRKDPTSGIISISQNDCHGPCQCAKCQALQDAEGAASGPVIHFVNAVAEEIEKEFPDALIETLAYSYTRQAPKTARPRKNVLIRLCSIECSFSQPLGTGPQNESFQKDMRDWSGIAHQLYVWDYVTNFSNYLLPHPNLRVLAPNIRYFVEHKAVGLFEQGDAGCSISDFPELRAWLFAHLMWDPSRDDKALIAEFLSGYYGPAAEPVQQYIDLIHNAVERNGTYLRCYMHNTSEWFGLDDINQATELFNEAEKRVAGNPELLARVQRARMPLDHTWLMNYRPLKRMAMREDKPFRGPEKPEELLEQYIARAHLFDAGSYSEGGPFSHYEELLHDRYRPAGILPELCKGLDPADFIDVQDNQFRLANPGEWANIADDPSASDGRTARMPSNHTQWAVQYPVEPEVVDLGKAHAYVVVRCDVRAGATGGALVVGIYDNAGKTALAQRTVAADDAAKGYCTVDLGTHTFTTDVYVWVAPLNNPDAIDAVYVDRIFFVRDKS
ncbi:MAG: DUF4838 domain-containing protein [Candidatus Hydrogenedentes bacterium]|nr:DUF4838 domain-containing protein [Candidatus Hydrogenedentota bacterium]